MLIRASVILTFLMICAMIAYMDIQKQTIYNEAVAVLFVPAIVSFFVFPEIAPVSRILGGISVSGMMFIINLLKPGAFGGGDIKMMVPVGLFLGFDKIMLAWEIAVFVGGIRAIMVIVGKKKRTFPFGPALCTGSVIALFCSI